MKVLVSLNTYLMNTLLIDDDFLGTYYCHVSNDLGQGEPCQIDLTMDMMTYWLTEEVTVILIAVAGSVIVLLIIIIITACLYCREKKENKGTGKMVPIEQPYALHHS